eukprot:1345284-Amorphochlora_amoeboformis.AAC.1
MEKERKRRGREIATDRYWKREERERCGECQEGRERKRGEREERKRERRERDRRERERDR